MFKHYNQTFKKKLETLSGPFDCSSSLLEWAQSNISIWCKNIPMLAIELGCGPKSILDELELPKDSQSFGVDFSSAMIDYARKLQQKVEYECINVLEIDRHPILGSLNFDLVVDGHLFHCLTDAGMRARYLSLVAQKLAVRKGYFLLECMVESAPLKFADDFLFLDDSRVLLQQIGCDAIPVRYIPTVHNIHSELTGYGLKIIKFHCPEDWKIITDFRRSEANEGDPGLARFLLASVSKL